MLEQILATRDYRMGVDFFVRDLIFVQKVLTARRSQKVRKLAKKDMAFG